MVQSARPADDAFTSHVQVRPHFAPTPGLTPFPRTRNPPTSPTISSTPHPHLVAYQVVRDLLRCYDAHNIRWCPHTGLNYAGSKNWTKFEDREKVLVLVVELKEEDLGKWRVLIGDLEAIREKHGLDGKVREESMWAYQGGNGVPIRFYVYRGGCTDSDDEEYEDAELDQPQLEISRREAETTDQTRARGAPAAPAARAVRMGGLSRQYPIAGQQWVLDRIECIMAHEGPQRRPRRTVEDSNRPAPSSAAKTSTPGDLHTMQAPLDKKTDQPQVIHTRAPAPTPRAHGTVSQRSLFPGLCWEKFNALIGRYSVAELREPGSGAAIVPLLYRNAEASARPRLQHQDDPLLALTAQNLAAIRTRQQDSIQLLESIRRDLQEQRDALTLSLGRMPTASATSAARSSSQAGTQSPAYSYTLPSSEYREPRPLASNGMAPLPRIRNDGPSQPQRSALSRRSSSSSGRFSSELRDLQAFIEAYSLDPTPPDQLPGSTIPSDPSTPMPNAMDEAVSRASTDEKSEREDEVRNGDADDEAELQPPTPPITPPADGLPRWQQAEQMAAAFREGLRLQLREAAEQGREPRPEVFPELLVPGRNTMYRARRSGGGLQLPPDVNMALTRTAEADGDMPAYFLDGEGAVR